MVEMAYSFHSYEHVFFFGDLNYRIDFKFQHTVELVARGDWDTLHTEDQLRGK